MRLQAAFMSLITGAARANSGTGQIAIQTRRINGSVEIIIAAPKKVTQSAENTTAVSAGGLLSTPAFGIIREHGGSLRFENSPKTAYDVTVSLPIQGPQAARS